VINDGAVLKNNNVSQCDANSQDANQGGAIFVWGTINAPATVTMNGGTIKDCTAWKGGGVYLLATSTFVMNGGTIENNSAVGEIHSAKASGGGVLVDGCAYMQLNDGLLQNNSAADGGAIALGGNYFRFNMQGTQNFVMNGGTLDGNTATTGGGGLYVQCTMLATINAGYITNNYGGYGNFGGGGIYVNGGRSTTFQQINDGVCRLYNVAITDNTVGDEGGGIAGCSTSTVKIYQQDGSVIYNNAADGQPSDLISSNSDGSGTPKGIPSKWINPAMLNDAAYMWQYTANGAYAGENNLQKDGAISLYTTQIDSATQAAKDAKVVISGNSAKLRGGGIGTNGVVIIGKEDQSSSANSNLTISVTKTWNDEGVENLRPSSIRVFLLRDGQKYSCLEFEGDDLTGTLTFNNLPVKAADGHEYVYTIEEEPIGVEGGTYEGGVGDPVETEGNIAYVLTNTFVPTPPEEETPDPEPTPDSDPTPEPEPEPTLTPTLTPTPTPEPEEPSVEPEPLTEETSVVTPEEPPATPTEIPADTQAKTEQLATTSDNAGIVFACAGAVLVVAGIVAFVASRIRRRGEIQRRG
jgi:hypothetical protein